MNLARFEQEHIELEPFDREYQIEELLPLDLLEPICIGSASMLPEQWALFTDKGWLHFKTGPWGKDLINQLSEYIVNAQPDNECALELADLHRAFIYPLEYELEIKGYMAIYTPNNIESSIPQHSGRDAVNLFKQLMRLKHQTMLTSGLHGLVVEDSYGQLKQKADQLSRSEEKYRQLAENLEIEVQNKTKDIKTAHAHIMQQEKMAAIGQLSAGMAHEINNPLGFIISNLNTLKSYGEDLSALRQNYRRLVSLSGNPADDDTLSSIKVQCQAIKEAEETYEGDFLLEDIPLLVDESITGVERIRKIVKDLKTVARPGEMGPELIRVQESIDAVLSIVQNRITPEITINRSYQPVPLIPGYPQEISQVWLNLIINALDALEGEGELNITTESANDHVVISFNDTGHGIAPQDLPKIFEPFFTTKEVGCGTGLGLHLVYNIVAKHDGRIEVGSQLHKGSTIDVHLPSVQKE